ncbi:MAG: transporter substrate-binding protein [Pirellulales bacterium]|nr:transporter substrate-binding protein [Pirellulales bacterium]
MSAGESDPLQAVKSQEKKPHETLAETAFQTDPATPQHPSPRRESPQSLIGQKLGKYEIRSIVGQGGMGVVYRAHDPMIERDVAVKLLAEHLTTDETATQRFMAEARAAGKLSHPNVTAVYEICHDAPRYYIVMELLEGGSLDTEIEQSGARSVLNATRAIIDACQGVAAAHAAGVIHRDIKPANFMRAADGTIKVTDFGLAKSLANTSRHITQTGSVLGTPYFMSPEQCMGKPLDPRTDIYSLGASYYCLLTGKQPYEETDSVPQLMFSHCHGPIPNPCDHDSTIPQACARIVARAMAKSPDDRYQSVAEMIADLQALYATLSGQAQMVLPSESGPNAALVTTMTATAPHLANVTPVSTQPAAATRSRRAMIFASVGILLALLVGGGFILWQMGMEASNAAADAAALTEEPIKVGIIHSMTGTLATSATAVVDTTLMAIDEVNARGGLLGRPIQPIVVDGGSDWGRFASETERLITQEKVVAIFGCWTSASRKAVKPIVEEHDHLLLYPLQYEGLETSPNIVYLGAAPNQQILPALDWAVEKLGQRKFFIVGSDYLFPRAATEVIKDHLKMLGAEVVGAEFLPLGSPHTEPLVEAIRAAQPDMILNLINGDSNIAFFRELREAGITSEQIPTLSFSLDEQGMRSLTTPEIAGDYAAWTYFDSLDTPDNKSFVERFHRRFPQRAITDAMESAYASVLLWAAAVEDAQSLDPKRVRRTMLTVRVMTPAGELRLDPDTQHTYKTPLVGQIQPDGECSIVWSGAAPLAPNPFPESRRSVEWKAFLQDLYNGWNKSWGAPAMAPGARSASP